MCRLGSFVQISLFCWLCWYSACFVTWSSFPSSGGFLTSCEAELQELMKQIDIMVAHKKSEWETQTQALEACLSVREQELASARAALQEKYKEVPQLHTVFWLMSTCVFYMSQCNIKAEPEFQSLTLHGHVFRVLFHRFWFFIYFFIYF